MSAAAATATADVIEFPVLSLAHARRQSFNHHLLNVEFEAPGGERWSTLGGGDTVEEAVAAARGALPENSSWRVVQANDWWGR